MNYFIRALTRAIFLMVAVALLHACGGGEQTGQEPTSKSTAPQDVWVQAGDEAGDLNDQEIEDELKAQGFQVVRHEVIDGRTAFLLQVHPGEMEQLPRVIKPLRWVIGTAASPELRAANTPTALSATGSKSPAIATKARTKAQLKFAMAPRTDIPFTCTFPDELDSHAAVFNRCNQWLALNSQGTSRVVDQIAVNDIHLVEGLPRRTVFQSQSLVGGVWRLQSGFEQYSRFLRAVCPAGKTVVEEVETAVTVINHTYWCEDESTEPQNQPPETKSDTPEAGMCTSNPIIPSSGEKIFSRNDVEDQAPHPLNFTRKFRTQWQIAPQARMGQLWAHNHSANLRLDTADAASNTLILQLADGSQRRFTRASATAAWTNASHVAQLTAATTTAGAPAWRYTSAEDDSQWLFTQPTTTTIGLLQSTRERNGWTYVYAYNAAGQLTQVTNHFGRTLRFTYHATSGLLASVIQPDTRTTQYTWDTSNRLTRVTHPDGRFLTYHHENTSFPQQVTGITDENGLRYSTYTYDAQGRATRSTLGTNIDTYTVAYSGTLPGFNTTATITDPIGTPRSYGYAQTNGHTNVVSGSNLPGCKGEPPIATRRQNPTSGLLEQETDFKGNVTQYSWNTARMLPQGVTRGYGTPLAQTTTTTWHPTFALPERITEPLRQTQFAYDAAGRLLSQTVTHTGGASIGKVQTTRYTYNAQGLLATRTEPNNAVTSFDQYSPEGLPLRVTNPLGHVTTLAYDSMGRPTQITQADGLVQTLSYDQRGRVLSSSAAAGGTTLTTAYTYTPSGQVNTITMPGGHAITYNHDIAQRVTGWSDNRGQSAAYTLDGLGNITNEQLRNNGGGVALQINRSVNAINRLASQTVGNSVSTTNTYDANGQLQRVTNAANHSTTFTLDALNRIAQITDALGQAAQLGYNGQNAVTSASDFKGVTTAYAPDAQGQPVGETSPDGGNRSASFDALNLPASVTDAIGRATGITRDLLGRPTLITHALAGSPTLSTELSYDLIGTACNATNHPNASRGRVCEVITRVGTAVQTTTRYQWDAFGRQTQQAQVISSAIASHHDNLITRYTHVASGAGAGQLATLTYPSGAVLTHQYSAAGRLTGLLWNGQPLVQGIVYNALGQPLSWTWAFADASTTTSVAALRSHDTAGQLRTSEVASFTPNTLGQLSAITQGLYQRNASGAWVAESVPHSATHDALGRLTTFSAAGSSIEFKRSQTYAWDNNGNRTLSTFSEDGALRGSSAAVFATTSNRLLTLRGLPQTLNAAGEHLQLGSLALAYDNAGRLSRTTQVEPVIEGRGAHKPFMPYAPASHTYNGLNQRVLRENPQGQTVYVYGSEGHNVLGEYQPAASTAIRWSNGFNTEHIYLPTAAGPMPIATVINGEHFAVHADHLNTPRRLTDRNGISRWQWAYSGFGEVGPQSLSTATLPEVRFNLRFPGQVDDANGLFYNWNRFYHPGTGRYTKADPIGLDGGWNRFGYGGGNPLTHVDPIGLVTEVTVWQPVGVASSSFGHVSTTINGTTWTFGPGGMTILQSTKYLEQNQFRTGVSAQINVTTFQENALQSCLSADQGKYHAFANNCGTPVQSCLKSLGIDTGSKVLPVALGNKLLDLGIVEKFTEHPQTRDPEGWSAPWAR